MRLRGILFTSMLATGSLVYAGVANAQQAPAASPAPEGTAAPSDTPPAEGRTLNGHTFIPSNLVAAPFTDTSFGSEVGIGLASYSPRLTTFGQSVLLGALSLGYDVQVGITDWFAIRGAIAGTATSGASLGGLLEFGVQIGYTGSAGVTFSLPYNNWFRMGFAFDAAYNPNYQVNILLAISRSIAARAVSVGTLLSNTQGLGVSGAWQVAISPYKLIGLFADFRYTHNFASFNGQATSDGNFTAGVGLSLDLHAVSPIPIGFLATYLATGSTQSGQGITSDVSAGVFYTGRRNVVIGPEAQITYLPNTPTTDALIVQAVFVLRYYW